jgi:DNA repair protein RadC
MKKYELTIKGSNTDFKTAKIIQDSDAADYIKQFYCDDIEIFESFFILLMNNANQTIGYAKISQGGCTGTVVDVKIVCKYVVDTLASGVILAHNHPSGTLKPSQQDIQLTKKLCDAIKLLDSVVIDHLILTKDSHFSFAENGLL